MNPSLSDDFLRYGSARPPPAPTPLRAGPLHLTFGEAGLRYIRFGAHELIRRIYVAVRDRNWDTVPTRLKVARMDVHEDAFEIECDAVCQQDEIDFFWRGTIVGERSGKVMFTMEGEARSTFLRNRIGLCVLHPPGSQGARCRVGQPDGTTIERTLPLRVAAKNPFTDMTSIAHEFETDHWCELNFEGDFFEMEDQRNWSDASFKTFCTPLRRPFPVEVATGTRIHQAVTLALTGHGALSPTGTSTTPHATIHIEETTRPDRALPAIGIAASRNGDPLTRREQTLMRALHPAHLRVDLRLDCSAYSDHLVNAATDASALGIPLEVALFVTHRASEELRALAEFAQDRRLRVCRWLVFHGDEPAAVSAQWCDLARRHLASLCTAAFGTGTDHSFVEINRCRPPVTGVDFVCFSVNPQVHAFDNLSLVETMATLAELVVSARALSGSKPIVVSPITLQMRTNPASTSPERARGPGELPSRVDSRQLSLFGAAWTLGSLKYLAEAGAGSVTCFETTGWEGVLERETGSALPRLFPSLPGEVFPLYHVLADIGEFAGGSVVPCRSEHPLQVEALLLAHGARRRALLANFATHPCTVSLSSSFLAITEGTLRRLNTGNARSAMREPQRYREQERAPLRPDGSKLSIELTPCEIACLDWKSVQ